MAAFLDDKLRLHSFSNPLMLDGDRLRLGLCSKLGFSDADRTENLRRAAEVARISIESGIHVVASFITPREMQRQLVQEIIGFAHVSFIHVSASLAVCRTRDVKGLYSRTQMGALTHMSGIDSAFDQPSRCDLMLDTMNSPVTDSGGELLRFALTRLGRARAARAIDGQ